MRKIGLRNMVLLLAVFLGVTFGLEPFMRWFASALEHRLEASRSQNISSKPQKPVDSRAQPTVPGVHPRYHEFKSFPSVAFTVKDAQIFEGDSHTKEVISFPKGQMLNAIQLADGWTKVQLYNGGPMGYTKPENLIQLENDGGGLGDFPLPHESHSVIDPKTDSVELLFTYEEPSVEKSVDIKDIDLQKEAKRFGIKGSVGRPHRDKGIILPNGIYAVIDRNFDESSVFFLNLDKRTMVGIINPTPPNWDMELCNGKLYVANGFSENDRHMVSIIDYTTMKIISSVNTGGTAAGLSCWQAKKLYATLPDKNVVAVIDTQTDAVIRTLKVGPAPWGLWRCQTDKICVSHKGLNEID